MLTPSCAIVNVCPTGMREIDCPGLYAETTCPAAVSLYTVNGVETGAVKFELIALSREVITNLTAVPAVTVMLLSFGPGPVVLVAGVGIVPFCRFAERTKAS